MLNCISLRPLRLCVRFHLPFTFLLIFQACALFAQPHAVKPLIIAHRGASGHAPENTIAAIDKALKMGTDVIEIDVHQTRDSVIMLMHDAALNRTTNMTGSIKDYNWDDIKDADAGSWFSEDFAGEKIPALDEVIKNINGRARLLIEIKKGGDHYPGIERGVLNIIKANHAESWCMIQSFSDRAVENFLNLKSGIKVYKLAVGNIPALPVYVDGKVNGGSILKYKNVTGINTNISFTRKRIVERLHERGQEVFVWTVNEEKKMRKLIRHGVDGIITNYPGRLKKVLADYNFEPPPKSR